MGISLTKSFSTLKILGYRIMDCKMQRLTKIGVAVGSVGIAIILGLLAIIESNPFNCPSNEFMCFEPPAARTAKFFLPEGIIIAAIGNALIPLGLWRKSSALDKNQV